MKNRIEINNKRYYLLNNYNENSISEKIIENIFNNKIKIIGKILIKLQIIIINF